MSYQADITAGALKIPESRVVADLLLQQADKAAWDRALFMDNVLQTRSPATARRVARLLRKRLEMLQPDLWRLVRDGSALVATQACLAAAIKHSALLGDFMDLVVREHYRLFCPVLPIGVWDNFILDCGSRDPDLPEWHPTTLRRLRSSVYQMLAQGGYLDSTRTRRLQTVHIAREVLHYLEDHDETYVLRCLRIAP